MVSKTLIFLVPLLACAQGLTGPRSGFVFDSAAKGIRPVIGIPGAASLGATLDLNGLALDQVEFSTSDVAYAVAAGRVYKITLSSVKVDPLEGTAPDAKLVAPGLLWSASTRTVQILPDGAPGLVQSDGALTAAVVSGNCAILAFDSGTVEQLCGANQSRLFSDSSTKMVALAAINAGIYAQDATRVLQIAPEFRTLANGARYVGLAVVNESTLAAADAMGRSVTFIGLDNGPTAAPIQLLFTPASLRHLDTTILQLGDAGPEPFEVIDLNQQNRNFFIPAIPSSSTTHAQTVPALHGPNPYTARTN